MDQPGRRARNGSRQGEMQMMPPTRCQPQIRRSPCDCRRGARGGVKNRHSPDDAPQAEGRTPTVEVVAMLLPGDPGYEEMREIEYVA